MPKECAFCGGESSTRPTDEHVWPKWLGKFLPGSHDGQFHHFRGTIGEGTDTQNTWTSPDLEVKAKAFCLTCNTGWMRELEEKVQKVLPPLIRGEKTRLSPEDRELIATWAMKTACTAEYSYAAKTRSIPDRHYRWFYERRCPPQGAHVLLACLPGGKGIWHRSHALGPAHGRSARLLSGYCSTFCIGDLVIQVLWVGENDDKPTTLRTSLGEATIGCWPRGHLAVTWPPSLVFDTEESLTAFCESPSVGLE